MLHTFSAISTLSWGINSICSNNSSSRFSILVSICNVLEGKKNMCKWPNYITASCGWYSYDKSHHLPTARKWTNVKSKEHPHPCLEVLECCTRIFTSISISEERIHIIINRLKTLRIKPETLWRGYEPRTNWEGIRGTVVARWTARQQVERSILRYWNDS